MSATYGPIANVPSFSKEDREALFALLKSIGEEQSRSGYIRNTLLAGILYELRKDNCIRHGPNEDQATTKQLIKRVLQGEPYSPAF